MIGAPVRGEYITNTTQISIYIFIVLELFFFNWIIQTIWQFYVTQV